MNNLITNNVARRFTILMKFNEDVMKCNEDVLFVFY